MRGSFFLQIAAVFGIIESMKGKISFCTFFCLVFFLTLYSFQEAAMSFELNSSVFMNGEEIPEKYTCEGRDISPPLDWSGLPAGTRSLVLIVDDPDAPDPRNPKMTWVHWVLYNIPPDAEGLKEGVTNLPPGTKEGLNDWNRTGYGGPCPPIGRHRYFFKLYALDTMLEGLRQPTKKDIEMAMSGHVLSEAVLMGTYQKIR